MLSRRRVYILPTKQGLIFALLLFAMLLGSMNYSSSVGFLLTFTLASLGFVAMHHTHRNLERLEIKAGAVESVFAGGQANFHLHVHNPALVTRGGVALDDRQRTHAIADIPADGLATLSLRVPAHERGWLKPERIGLHTTYPFGFFKAWAWLHMDLRCLVYPVPAEPSGLPPPSAIESGSERSAAAGQEDFSELRAYRPGDAPRHVAWRASARLDGDLLVKEFQGGGAASRWLRWEDTDGEVGVEARISRLTRWVVDAHAREERWGLELPGVSLPLAGGEHHYRRSLRELALFALPEDHRQ